MRFLTLLAFLLVVLLVAALAPPSRAAAPAQPPGYDEGVQMLIEGLADPSPVTREQSKQKLIAMGPRARPALVDAWRGNDPRIGPVAGEILLKLPWALPSDPPGVRRALSGYGDQDEDKRRETVQRLYGDPGAAPALVRLLEQDPSDRVAWTILGIVRRRPDDAMFERLRQLPTETADGRPLPMRPQALAAAGLSWLPKDWDKGLALLGRAVDGVKDIGGVGSEDGSVDFAYDLLVADAIAHESYDRAAELRRAQVVTTPARPFDTDAAPPMLDLFALHADFGPLAGFDDDLTDYADELGRPEVVYSIARVEERAGNGLMAMALRQEALSTSLIQPESHLRIGAFLHERKWHADAEREFAAVTACGASLDPPRKAAYDLTAGYYLGQIAVDRGDDAAAATHFQMAQDASDKSERDAVPGGLDLREQVHTRRLRAARASNGDGGDGDGGGAGARADPAAAQRELDELLTLLRPAADKGDDLPELRMRAQRVRAARAAHDDRLAGQRRDELLKAAGGIPDADAVIEATSYLRELGRADEAQKLFERAYVIQEAAAGEPDTASNLNNLAWLCARCEQRLPESAAMSRRAVAAAPESAGFWDTAAEAAFKTGDAETAVKFEERAMSLEPNDRFMERQLTRFRAGKSDH